MGLWFWLVVAICYLGIVLLGVVNIGAFILRYRAGRNPPRAQLVRGVMILGVFLLFPRILSVPWLWTAVLAAVLVWEVATWFSRSGERGERNRSLPIVDNRSPLTNGPA
jgi:hypothetical protein